MYYVLFPYTTCVYVGVWFIDSFNSHEGTQWLETSPGSTRTSHDTGRSWPPLWIPAGEQSAHTTCRGTAPGISPRTLGSSCSSPLCKHVTKYWSMEWYKQVWWVCLYTSVVGVFIYKCGGCGYIQVWWVWLYACSVSHPVSPENNLPWTPPPLPVNHRHVHVTVLYTRHVCPHPLHSNLHVVYRTQWLLA